MLEKIEVFSHTNHRIRELLREWTEYEVREAAGTPAECMSACGNSAVTGIFFSSMSLHPQRASLMWSAEKDVLKKRMADNEAENVVSMRT